MILIIMRAGQDLVHPGTAAQNARALLGSAARNARALHVDVEKDAGGREGGRRAWAASGSARLALECHSHVARSRRRSNSNSLNSPSTKGCSPSLLNRLSDCEFLLELPRDGFICERL